jgi:hypothetical protein
MRAGGESPRIVLQPSAIASSHFKFKETNPRLQPEGSGRSGCSAGGCRFVGMNVQARQINPTFIVDIADFNHHAIADG